MPSLLIDLFSLCGCGSSVLFSFHHQDWEPGCGRKMLAHLKCYDLCSVQFLNIITLKWLDCVIIRVAERQAKYDHYSCYYFLWSSRTMVVMINECSLTLLTLQWQHSWIQGVHSVQTISRLCCYLLICSYWHEDHQL